MPTLSYAKTFKGVADVFLRDPDLYVPLLRFIEVVVTRDSALSIAEREMIAAHVSRLNGCAFCVGIHKATMLELGVDRRAADAVADGADAASVDGKLRAILDFAESLTMSPEIIGQTDVDAVLEAGWPEQAVEDAINVTALFNYVNRLVDAFGIEGEDSYFKDIGAILAKQGYAPLIEMAAKRAA